MPDIRNALTEVMDLEHQGSDDEMQPLRPEHHQSRWYARRRVQLLLVAGLVALLVIVLAGPRPRVQADLLDEAEADPAGSAAAATSRVAAAGTAAAQAAVGRHGCGTVQVDFYGESLCPDCQHMVRDVLVPMFKNGVSELMHLRYHAFGNVRNGTDGTYQYQHGPAEGKWNRYMLCAQSFHKGQKEWFPYVKCFADNMHSLDSKADGCAEEQGWKAADISACAEGDKGKELEREAAAATWALQPPKNFVPWMVVNGVAIGSDYDKLQLYVCAASTAENKPDACHTLPKGMEFQGR